MLLGSSCTQKQKADISKAVCVYEANTRGYFRKIIVQNQKVEVFAVRDSKESTMTKISDKDWKELLVLFKAAKLADFPKYKDPTQKRFYDGAAIANLSVKYQSKTYQTTDFDNGYPPVEIEKLVNKLLSLVKEKEE